MKQIYCGKKNVHCSDGHRIGTCCLIKKNAQLCKWEREIKSYEMGGKVLKVGLEEGNVLKHQKC